MIGIQTIEKDRVMATLKPTPAPKAEYRILDPNCRELANQRIAPGQTTIMLTEAQARFYLANGSIVPVQS